MTPTVERATDQDIPAWIELAREVGVLFGADMANDPEFRASLERNVARGSALCARIDGELAGAMLFRDGHIHWLAVSRRFQRRGVARSLVAYALGAGASEIRVTTFAVGHPHSESAAARALFHGLGFTPADESPVAAPDGTPREILVWRSRPVFGSPPSGVACSPRLAVYVVVLDTSERVAAARVVTRSGPRHWLPGGEIEADETGEQAASREVREELGRDVRITARLGEAVQYFYAIDEERWYEMTATFFRAELVGDVGSDAEHLCDWVDLAQAGESFFHASHVWAARRALGL
jgi:ADP-ribose pyrophosphatase YjhB (NUDIX family)/ribosomal protein S18 acetylase RimI-like enzyme